jgi:hypothetical protein
MRVLLALVAACCLIPAALMAKQNPIKQIIAVKGKCDKLAVSGKAITPKCKGLLWNTSFADSRTGFYFFTEDGAALVFSGIGKNQVKHGDKALELPIDRIIFGFQKRPDPPMKASGGCIFENPFAGVAHVTCKAEGPTGHFEGIFVTDGKPPVAGSGLKTK